MEKITGEINVDNVFLTKNLDKFQNIFSFSQVIEAFLNEEDSYSHLSF